MRNTHADLQYLTVDSIQWATGHQRPRMPIEQKRAKHRVHQRQFMQRQRQRIEQLRRDVRRHSLQFQMLEAAKEAAALMHENAAMQLQIQNSAWKTVPEDRKMPFVVDCQEATACDDEEAAILEMLDVLPDIDQLRAESPTDVGAFAWCHDETQAQLLAWPTSPSCSTSFLALLGRV